MLLAGGLQLSRYAIIHHHSEAIGTLLHVHRLLLSCSYLYHGSCVHLFAASLSLLSLHSAIQHLAASTRGALKST